MTGVTFRARATPRSAPRQERPPPPSVAGTARTSLRAAAGHVAPGWRADLVDAVTDLPEVQASHRLEATVPLGDGEFLGRLRERTTGAVVRPAGSTLLLDATIPPQRLPSP